MEMLSLEQDLKSNSYPGRGIVIGRSGDGKSAVTAYFIMGRSENSRNRVFVEDGEGIRTQAFDPSKLTDPSLIIYAPVRVLGNKTIVTNGDQTDTIYEGMDKQLTFEQSLRIREFEPDAPNYTPRISGTVSYTHLEGQTLTIPAGSEVMISENVTLDLSKAAAVILNGKLINHGTVLLNGAVSVNAGVLENLGTVKETEGTALKNDGEISSRCNSLFEVTGNAINAIHDWDEGVITTAPTVTSGAVSYTHLDVYKRQVILLILRERQFRISI